MKLLFFDEFHLQSLRGMHFRAHQAVKDAANPVLRPEYPWEGWRAFPISNCVMRDPADGLFKMWYETAYDEHSVPGERLNRTAYATSQDGVAWTRPNLGQYTFHGSTDNSIIGNGPFGNHDVNVVRDDHDPNPHQRYKMTFFTMPPGKGRGLLPAGINVAVSHNGTDWRLARPAEDPAFRAWRDVLPGKVTSSDTHALVGWVPERERYVLLTRSMKTVPFFYRTIGYSESVDFVNWSDPVSVLSPDEQDPYGTEFYYLTALPYEGLYIGALCVFYNYSRRLTAGQSDTVCVLPELAHLNQRLEVRLVYSRDLQVWRYADRARRAFIPLGEPGSWDSGMIFGSSILAVGDEILAYYGATPMRHIHEDLQHAGTTVNGQLYQMCGGLARLRRDGFVSLRADQQPGECITLPLTLSGEAVRLNAKTADTGRISIQLLDADNDSALGEAVHFQGDALNAMPDLPTAALAGQRVRLHITAHEADLFSITV